MKIKIILFTILLVLLFYFSIFFAGLFPFIAQYKTDLTPFVINDYIMNVLFHPIENIKAMYKDENPLLYISFGAGIFIYFYLMYKSRYKEYENVGDKYGVQGSSRWAKNSEILKVPHQITVIPSQGMLESLKMTMDSSRGDNNEKY